MKAQNGNLYVKHPAAANRLNLKFLIKVRWNFVDLVCRICLKLSPYFDGIPQIICQWHVKINVFGKAAAMWNDRKPNTDEEKQQMRELREQFMVKFESLL